MMMVVLFSVYVYLCGVVLDLTMSNPAGWTWPDLGTQIQIWEIILGSRNNTPDETNGVNNADS